jgi:hypothetical protein
VKKNATIVSRKCQLLFNSKLGRERKAEDGGGNRDIRLSGSRTSGEQGIRRRWMTKGR